MNFRKLAFASAFVGGLVFSSIVAFPSSSLRAQENAEVSADIIAQRFGVRPSVLNISLSPSGQKVAWIAAGPEHTEVLNVYDFNSTEGIKQVASNSEITGDLRSCEWATDDRIVCQIYGITRRSDGVLLGFRRMFAINSDGSEPLTLSQRDSSRARYFSQDGGGIVALDVAGEEGNILITREYVPERSIGTRLANTKEGLGVDRLDLSDGKRQQAERPDELASYYLADENGEIRLKARSNFDARGYETDNDILLTRGVGGKEWSVLPDMTLNGEPLSDFDPVTVDASRNAVLAFTPINGFEAVIELPLDGSTSARVLASRNDVDVDSLIRIGRQRRVVGVSFATEKRSVQYFDEEIEKLSSSLSKALPNQPLVSIAGASADERRLLIIGSSDTDPGVVYVYDKDKRSLEQLLAMREFLVEQPMGQMKPITYGAADGTQIPGYLTLPPGSDGKNLPAIVLPHGGPAARDYWGFDWIVQYFTARGFAVLQPNYRGSAGYGEAWLGRNGYQSWDVAIGDVNDAGRWLISEGIADADKLAIVGWSYGGYAALQSQVVDADLYKAVAAIAPVTDLEFLRADARQYTSFRFRDKQLGEGPHIAAGSPRRHAAAFKAPVALFHGTLDTNVDVRHSRAMEDALKDAGKSVSYAEYEDLQHSLSDSKVRAEMLDSIGQFLDKALNR